MGQSIAKIIEAVKEECPPELDKLHEIVAESLAGEPLDMDKYLQTIVNLGIAIGRDHPEADNTYFHLSTKYLEAFAQKYSDCKGIVGKAEQTDEARYIRQLRAHVIELGKAMKEVANADWDIEKEITDYIFPYSDESWALTISFNKTVNSICTTYLIHNIRKDIEYKSSIHTNEINPNLT